VSLLQDAHYGLRILRKNPGFTAVAVLTLALGIGANTAIFSVVNAVLLQPLPFPQSQRLVSVEYLDSKLGTPHSSVSYPDFFDWRRQNDVFSYMAAFHASTYTLTGTGRAVHLNGEIVTADFFTTLNIAPQLGRGFLPDDEIKGHRVVFLSDPLWRMMFGADKDIIGRGIRLNNQSYTVVGVAPPDFEFPIVTPVVQLWTTAADDADVLNERGAHYLSVTGRLKSGATVAQAQSNIAHINANLASQYPESNLHFSAAHVEPELQHMVGDTRLVLMVLFGAVACVLLIACANVANLLLAHATARQKEMAIRGAIGASRRRIVGQLLAESIVLSLFGGVLGMVFAFLGTSALVRLVPKDIPRMSLVRMDAGVFAFALVATVLTGVVFGLIPALRSSKIDLVPSLKEGGRGGSGGVQHNRLRGAFVITEMALALALLIGAGLMIQSLARLENVNPGFDSHNLLTFTFDLPEKIYSIDRQKIYYRQALDQMEKLPTVVSAAGALPLPLSGINYTISFTIEGRPVAKGNAPREEVQIVSPGYFHAMGIPLLHGREFAATETPTSPYVVIVNQAFVKKYFQDGNPLGRRINPGLSDNESPQTPLREIVGVVGDVKTRNLSRDTRPEYYFPYQQALIGNLAMVLRTKANPEAVLGDVRNVIRSMDPDIALYNEKTMDQYLGRSVAQPLFGVQLLSIFAALALILTAFGLYGVISYSVAQRTHEIGIRMALGAQSGKIMAMIIRQSMILTGIGWVGGIFAGFVLTHFLSSQLFGIGTTDLPTLLVVTVILGIVAIAASYVPARRAMRVDPIVALRGE
jgi:putative ABC transport system permease protein